MTLRVDPPSSRMSDSTTTRLGLACHTTVTPTNQMHTHTQFSCSVGWNPNPAVSIGLFKQTTGPAACGAKKLPHAWASERMNTLRRKQVDVRKVKACTDFFQGKIHSKSEVRMLWVENYSQLGSSVTRICTVSAQTLLTGRRRGRPLHAATEIRLEEVICLLRREGEWGKAKKNRG